MQIYHADKIKIPVLMVSPPQVAIASSGSPKSMDPGEGGLVTAGCACSVCMCKRTARLPQPRVRSPFWIVQCADLERPSERKTNMGLSFAGVLAGRQNKRPHLVVEEP